MRTLDEIPRRLVIAIGGNAVHPEDISGTSDEQNTITFHTPDVHAESTPPATTTNATPASSPASPGQARSMQDMDHGSMHGADHGSMPDMDHGSTPDMDHGSTPGMDHGATPATTQDATQGMDHGDMNMQGGSAPPDARDPHAYSGGYQLGVGKYALGPARWLRWSCCSQRSGCWHTDFEFAHLVLGHGTSNLSRKRAIPVPYQRCTLLGVAFMTSAISANVNPPHKCMTMISRSSWR